MALGIRYSNKIAIDLWQGRAEDFETDITLTLAGKTTAAAIELISLATTLLPNADDVQKSGQANHAKIIVPETLPPTSAPSAMTALEQSSKDEAIQRNIRRITWIMPSLEHYDAYLAALFEIFPEREP